MSLSLRPNRAMPVSACRIAGNSFHSGLHASKSVRYDAAATGWENEAFKVTNDGYATPKTPKNEFGLRFSMPTSVVALIFSQT